MHRGYLKLWRKIEDSGLLQIPNTYALFMFLLLKSAHKPKKIGTPHGVVELQRGEYISGRIELALALKQTERQIRTSLDRLKEMDILTIKSTSRYSIYTIVKYEDYQTSDQVATSTTPTDDQRSTSGRPADDQQATTKQELNNLKNEKNVKNKEGAAFALPDWIDKTHWDIWVKARKKMNNDQKQMQVDKLKAWKDEGWDFAGALANAAANGTQGLFLPDSRKKQVIPKQDSFDTKDYGQGVNSL